MDSSKQKARQLNPANENDYDPDFALVDLRDTPPIDCTGGIFSPLARTSDYKRLIAACSEGSLGNAHARTNALHHACLHVASVLRKPHDATIGACGEALTAGAHISVISELMNEE